MKPVKKFNDFMNEGKNDITEISLTQIINEAKQRTLAEVLNGLIDEFDDAVTGLETFVNDTMSNDDVDMKDRTKLKMFFRKAGSDFDKFKTQLETISKEVGHLKMSQ